MVHRMVCRMRRRAPRGAAVAVLLVLTASACVPDTDEFRPLAVGEAAPGFALPRLDGDTIDLTAMRGDVVLLNIWATWCPPCREEMPGLQTLHERYGQRGLRVVGVSIDNRGAEDAIRGFAADHGLTFTLLHDVAEVVPRRYRTVGVPETFLIAPDGSLAHRWIGLFDPVAPDVFARIEALLPPPDPQ
jgi:peroxiredoxin